MLVVNGEIGLIIPVFDDEDGSYGDKEEYNIDQDDDDDNAMVITLLEEGRKLYFI